MAGKPELSATPGVQNVVVYVSNDNFAQAYAVGQQNVAQSTSPYPPHSMATMAQKAYHEKPHIKPDYGHLEGLQGGYFTGVLPQNGFPQPLINYQVKSYNGSNGDVLSGERQAGPGRPDLKDCDNFVDSGYVTVMGADGPGQSVRCDSVRSETAESSCSSLSSADEGMVVVQNQPQDMVVYDSSVSVRPGGVTVFAVGTPGVSVGAAQPSIAVPYGWKRIFNNGAVIYIRYNFFQNFQGLLSRVCRAGSGL